MRAGWAFAGLSLVLIVACAEPAPGSQTTTDADATPATGQRSDGGTPSADVVPITCSTFYRSSVTRSNKDGPVLLFDGTGQQEKKAEFKELTLRGTHWNDEFEGRSLSLSVSEPGRKQPLFSQLFQMSQNQAPDNIFGGTGQGFTGLLYAYSSNGAELQFYCTSG